MGRLVAGLDAWAAQQPQDAVAVIFDGRARALGASAPHVEVGWAPGGLPR